MDFVATSCRLLFVGTLDAHQSEMSVSYCLRLQGSVVSGLQHVTNYMLNLEPHTGCEISKEQLVDWLGCLGSVPSLFVSFVAILCNFPIRSSLFNLANWKTIIHIILVGGFKHEFYFPYGMSSFPRTNSYFSKWLLHH